MVVVLVNSRYLKVSGILNIILFLELSPSKYWLSQIWTSNSFFFLFCISSFSFLSFFFAVLLFHFIFETGDGLRNASAATGKRTDVLLIPKHVYLRTLAHFHREAFVTKRKINFLQSIPLFETWSKRYLFFFFVLLFFPFMIDCCCRFGDQIVKNHLKTSFKEDLSNLHLFPGSSFCFSFFLFLLLFLLLL